MVFEDVLGQEHVTRTLTNALKNTRIAHAYIFAGPRGVGKTTTARLLAKAVNCENQPAVNPCNTCASCKNITDGHSMDVIEIDGASNRGIDEIRNLRENIRFSPAGSRYKIYIIDEVHMLTKEAFNALLKTLEEPPAHAIFIFATTEIHKVPLTILSRCQRFDFKRIPIAKIQEQLHKIVANEKIEIDDEALYLISSKADGSMRDAESILDQMISFSDGNIAVEQVRQSLGIIDQEIYFEFTDLLKEKDTAKVLQYAAKIIATGHDLMDFLNGLQEHFRNILIMAAVNDLQQLNVADIYKTRYQEQAGDFPEKDVIHYLQIVSNAENELKYSSYPQLYLEMLLIKLVHKPMSSDLETIMAFIEKLKMAPNIRISQGDDQNSSTVTPKAEKQTEPATNVRETAPELTASIPAAKSEEPTSGEQSNLFSGLQQKVSELKRTQSLSESQEKPKAKPVEITFEQIEQKWPQIVEEVRKKKVALGAFLQDGIPRSYEEGILTVAYDTKAVFQKEHVERSKKFVEEILNNMFKTPLRIDLINIDFDQQGIQMAPRTPEEILEDIKSKEPVIKKVMELFDLDDLEQSR